MKKFAAVLAFAVLLSALPSCSSSKASSVKDKESRDEDLRGNQMVKTEEFVEDSDFAPEFSFLTTDRDEQTYTNYINSRDDWEFVSVYTDV